ncbi:hypothetical protein [Anaerosphaera multitolerans]|uniref:ABC transporter permease n=1 Tax=Anaerosphaera multitolerans TaxID=2487351 RepID=A0A437S5Z3_9FIRM|nr:hypothetical protein [Anaerosphaera multitolerans]RVU54398.1 hypothetical protein EF514_07320 [Anaerosphaera multitolerans]
MYKIFYYEVKRLIINKYFVGLLFATLLYSYLLLSGEIILGVANTAPFSPWSFGFYISKIMPIILITLLFFISFLFSREEKTIQAITNITSVNIGKFYFVRLMTIIVSFMIILAVPILYSFYFYKSIFQYSMSFDLLIPLIIIVIPSVIIIMGLGLSIGSILPIANYLLMGLLIFVNFINLPEEIDLYGRNFFVNYPLSIGILDPAFKLSFSFGMSRLLFLVVGLFLIVLYIKKLSKKIYNF